MELFEESSVGVLKGGDDQKEIIKKDLFGAVFSSESTPNIKKEADDCQRCVYHLICLDRKKTRYFNK